MSTKSADDLEIALTGYQAGMVLWAHNGQSIWSSFNAMLIANSILVVAYSNDKLEAEIQVALIVAAVAISVLSLFMNYRLFEYHDRHIRAIRRLEVRYLRPPVKTVSVEPPTGPTIKIISRLVIAIFVVVHLSFLASRIAP